MRGSGDRRAPTVAPNSFDVPAYYRAVAEVLVGQLAGRAVVAIGPELGAIGPSAARAQRRSSVRIDDAADLEVSIMAGVFGFGLPAGSRAGLVTLHLRAGTGTGSATVSAAALSLLGAMNSDGRAAVALSDGTDGLYLVAITVGPAHPGTDGAGYAGILAARAPEIATLDPDDDDGRALIIPMDGPEGAEMPAPYSLVPIPAREDRPEDVAERRWGVAAPLTGDEVAAASAGMPLDIRPEQVVERLRTYGDLAGVLTGSIGHSA